VTDYSLISAKTGHKLWVNSITHDDGQFASDGGGKSTGSFSSPGKGKSTLMCYAAQSCRYLYGSKHDFVETFCAGEPTDSFKVFKETVIWRVRDFDAFANIIPENWAISFKNGGWCAGIKDLYLFVHNEDDLLFYSYNYKKQPIPVRNLPPVERYSDTDDLMHKLHWGAINAVVEPQTYHLSLSLIQKLREKKMDQSNEDDLTDEIRREKMLTRKSRLIGENQTREIIRKPSISKRVKNAMTEYERREVNPAYFWFDLIHTAMESNRLRHITICIDEWDDIAEARKIGRAHV
jgi:hypothetical protein